MEDFYQNSNEEVFSKRVKAGKRTYFVDVKPTRGNDFYITITESKRRFDASGYEKHKIFIYKEDFNKFSEALLEAITHVKTELLPHYDFDKFSHEEGSLASTDNDDFDIEKELSALDKKR
jgi:hypothetical protein